MKNEEIVYFDSPETRLTEMAKKHPDYVRIYMNVSKKENRTSITLSKHEGEVLYILSNVDKKNCSGYFKRTSFEQRNEDIDKKQEEKHNRAKRTKQSTLSSFIKK